MMRKLWLPVLALLLLAGCDSSKVFQRYEDLPNNTWSRDQVITFEVPIDDPAPSYDVELAVRHTSYYTWANLMVNITTRYPSGEERTKDHDLFIRSTDGAFKGEGAGDLWDINFKVMDAVTFPEKGTYVFRVQNIMPTPETQDIMQIGLIVKKSK